MPGQGFEKNIARHIRASFKILGRLAAERAVRVSELHNCFGAGTDLNGLAEIDVCGCRRTADERSYRQKQK